MTERPLIWLAWERQEDGSFRVLETREDPDGDTVRQVQEFASLEEATDAYGPAFRELAQKVLESGSDRGRYRP